MTEKVLPYDHSPGIEVQSTYYWCGPTSAEIVLNGRGVIMSQQDLANEIGTTVNGTDYVGLIERALNRHLPEAFYTSVYSPIDPEVLWANIVHSIDAGYGCVFNIDVPPSNYPRGVLGSASPAYKGGEIFHYIGGMGYNDDNPNLRAVRIADPGFRPFEYWVALDQLATMIPPKGYAYAKAQLVVNDSVEAVMATNQEKFDDIHREDVTQKGPSRSFMADGGAVIDTPLGIHWNNDGNLWNTVMTNAYLFDVPYAVDVVENIAKHGVYPDTYAASQPWLAKFGQDYCKGLVRYKAALKKLLGI